MSSIWANFDFVFEVFQGLFFAFLFLQRKDALGTRLNILFLGDFYSFLFTYSLLSSTLIVCQIVFIVRSSKLFTADTKLFSTIKQHETTATDLYRDLKEINNWTFCLKMSFTPNPSKQAQVILFSRKITESTRESLRPLTLNFFQQHSSL